jgi:hypothetical protein
MSPSKRNEGRPDGHAAGPGSSENRPLAGLKVFLSGPGDRYGAVDPTPRESAVKAFHGTVRQELLKLGASVVRDRNFLPRDRDYDEDKVRFLLRTCDAIIAFCYGRTRRDDQWATSPYVLNEISLAAESAVSAIVVLRETGVDLASIPSKPADVTLDEARLTDATTRARTVEVSPEAPDALATVRRLVFEACSDVNAVTRRIFTVIPFKKEFNPVFGVVQSVLEERTRLPVVRMKDMLTESARKDRPVIDAVLDSIGQATVVVLELSEQNPNCFFEAGVAFARGVPTIRLIRDKEEIPFDVRGWDFIKYRDLDDLRKKLERQADRFARDEVTVERLE